MSTERSSLSRSFLTAWLAVERGLVDRATMLDVVREWAQSDGSRRLEQHLAAAARLDPGQLALLEIEAERELGLTPIGSGAGSTETVAYLGPLGPVDAFAGGPADGPRFEVVRAHARGGLGEVFLAIDRELKRTVALKELAAERAHDPDAQARFLVEAELTGRLEHPGIVPVYSLGRHRDGRPFYTMRFVEGETLGSAIARYHQAASSPGARDRKPGVAAPPRDLVFQRLLRCVIDACNAVAFAHSRGVVHRDLKPENVMLGQFGETLVVDWGVAKSIEEEESFTDTTARSRRRSGAASVTRPGALVGTPRYMSPEQASGDLALIGLSSDIYALGAILYEVLTGRSPYPDGDVRSVLRRAKKGVFPSPRRVRKDVDPVLEAITLKAMSREPSQRQASALELATELEAWLADSRYRGEQAQALGEAQISLARLTLARAHQALERGARDEGLLWLVRAIEHAGVENPTNDLARVARASLAGWFLGSKRLERVLRHPSRVAHLDFCLDGRRLLAACDDGSTRIWDLSSGSLLVETPATHPGLGAPPALHPQGSMLATVDAAGVVHLWDIRDGHDLGHYPLPAEIGPVRALSFLAGEARLVILGSSRIALWERPGSTIEFLEPPTILDSHSPIRAQALTRQGNRLAVAYPGGHIRVFDTATRRNIGTAGGPGPEVTCLAFAHSADRLLIGLADGTTWIWDLGNETHPSVVSVSHPPEICHVVWRPDGRVFATASTAGSARLWATDTGQPWGEPINLNGSASALAMRSDGCLLATIEPDGRARLWCARTALPVGPPIESGTAEVGVASRFPCVAFSPDGRRLVTAGLDGGARCWIVPEPVPGVPERIDCWVRSLTGLELDPGGAVRPLDGSIRWDLGRRLIELGGAPLR